MGEGRPRRVRFSEGTEMGHGLRVTVRFNKVWVHTYTHHFPYSLSETLTVALKYGDAHAQGRRARGQGGRF